MASRTMAARIERAECETVLAFAARAQARGRDVMIHEIGGTSAVFAGPGQPINKLAGLGFAPIDAGRARGRRARLRRAAGGAARRARDARRPGGGDSPDAGADTSWSATRTCSASRLTSGDLVSELARATRADAAGGVVVSRVDDGDTRVWIETVADGFSHPDQFDGPPPTESFDRDQIVDVFMASSGTAGTALYLARRDGAIAGGGSIRISNALVAALRRLDAAGASPPRRPVGAPARAPARRRRPGLRPRDRHHRARIEVAGKRPARRLLAALRPRGTDPTRETLGHLFRSCSFRLQAEDALARAVFRLKAETTEFGLGEAGSRKPEAASYLSAIRLIVPGLAT